MLRRIEEWHGGNEHKKIIEELDKIPREFWDYEVTCLYARALNNLEKYEDAFKLLADVKTQGKNDPLWHFRAGYSLYYLGREEEAAKRIQRAIELGDNGKDTRDLLNACLGEAEQKKNNQMQKYTPILYSEEEIDAIDKHIVKYFGPYKNVFHEITSPDIHVDIAIIEPTKKRNYYVLVTMGMGARKMNIPEELEQYNLERAELLVCLPPDWKLDKLEEEKWYWPLRWLKILARLPGEKDTWLGWGHTIPNGGPFADNTRQSSVMLITPGAFGKKSRICRLPSGDEVNFYQILPLYNEEIDYKFKHDAEALLELMDDADLEFIKLNRRIVTEKKKP